MVRISTIDMAPFFYIPHIPQTASIELDADTSHHIAQVLRMQVGEALHITDGLGNKVTGILQVVSKKACCLLAEQRTSTPWSGSRVHLAIAPVKNNSRFEWFIEKATELGVEKMAVVQTELTQGGNDFLDSESLLRVIVDAVEHFFCMLNKNAYIVLFEIGYVWRVVAHYSLSNIFPKTRCISDIISVCASTNSSNSLSGLEEHSVEILVINIYHLFDNFFKMFITGIQSPLYILIKFIIQSVIIFIIIRIL
jgi:hypothetical protein